MIIFNRIDSLIDVGSPQLTHLIHKKHEVQPNSFNLSEKSPEVQRIILENCAFKNLAGKSLWGRGNDLWNALGVLRSYKDGRQFVSQEKPQALPSCYFLLFFIIKTEEGFPLYQQFNGKICKKEPQCHQSVRQ